MNRSVTRASTAVALALLASAAIVRPAHADTRTWIDDQNISMDWSDTDNWFGGIEATGAEEIADFTLNVPAGGLTVNLNVDRTVGQLIFGDTDSVGSAGGWTLSGASTLTLNNDVASPVITVNTLAAGQFAQISTVLAGTNGFTKSGVGALELTGANTLLTTTGTVAVDAGALRLKDGGTLLDVTSFAVNKFGTLVIDNSGTNLADDGAGTFGRIKNTAAITMNGGALTYQGHAADASIERIGTLSVAGAGTARVSVNGAGAGLLQVTTLTRAAGNTGMLIMKTDNAAGLGASATAPRIIFDNIASPTAVTFMGGWAIVEDSVGKPAFAVHEATGGNGVRAMTGSEVGFTYQAAHVAGATPDTDHFYYTAAANPANFNPTAATKTYESFTWAPGDNVSRTGSISSGKTLILGSGGLLRSATGAGQTMTISAGSNSTSILTAGATFGSANNLYVHAGSGAASGFIIAAKITDNGSPVTLQVAGNNGAGVTLTNSNAAGSSYTGGTIINSGFLSISKAAHVGTSGVTIAGGTLRTTATFAFNTAAQPIITTSPDSAIEVTGAFILTVNVNSNISGAGGITKLGTGTLTLGSVNTYSGGTTINAGTVSISDNAHLGDANGGVTLAGGILKWSPAAPLTWSATRALSTTSATSGFEVTTAASTVTIGNAITGSGGINKLGAGTLVLSSAGNSYSGGTTVTAGVLSVGDNAHLGAAAGGLTLAGGTLLWTGGTAQPFGGRALSTTSATSILNVPADTVLTIATDIDGAGGLTKAGLGTLHLSQATPYTYAGPTNVNAGILRVGGNTTLGHRINLGGGTLETSGAFARDLIATATVSNLATDMTWTTGGFAARGAALDVDFNGAGATNLVWNSITTPGFVAGILSSGSATSDNVVTFVDNINLNAANRTVDVADNTSTTADRTVFSGVISGTGAASKLIKTGTGLLELSNAGNTYEGGTTISGGTLEVASDGALSTGPVVVSGGTLKFAENLTWNPARTLQMGGANNTIEVISDKTVTIGIGIGLVGSNKGMIKTGAGTLVFSGNAANTFGNSDPTIVNEGKLVLQKTAGVNAVATNSLVIASGATVELGASNQITSSLAIAGTFDMKSFEDAIGATTTMSDGLITGIAGSKLIYTNSGSIIATGTNTIATEFMDLSARTINTPDAGDSLDISSQMLTGSLIKTGDGTFTISGTTNNTFVSSVVISGGTVILNKSAGVDAIGNTVSGTQTITVGSGATLKLAADEQIPETGSRPLTINGGAFDLQGFNETLAGLITLNSGTITGAANGTLILGHNIVSTGASSISTEIDLTASRNLTVNTGELTISGVIGETIAGTGSGLTKLGVGTVTLTGSNSYTGNTAINVGVLNIRNNAALGAGAGTTTVATGAALEIQNNITSSENIAATGTGIGGAGAIRSISGSNALNGILTLADASIGVDSGDLTIGAAIDGATSLTKVGGGELILTANNTFTGAVTIDGGALTLAGAGKLAQTTFAVNAGGSLTLDNSTTNDTDRLLDGAGLVLSGANFTFKGRNGELSSEDLGALTVLTGSSVAIVNGAAPGSTSVLTFSSFAPNDGATVDFSATGLGMLGAAGSNNSRIFLNGVSAGLMPYATVDGAQLAVYDIANGVRAMAEGAGDDDYVLAGGGPGGPHPLVAGRYNRLVASTLDTGDKSVRGLFLADGMNHVQSGGALTLTTPSNVAHIIKAGAASTISGGTLRGGTTATELLAIVNGTGGLTIESIIADNGAATSLTKSGLGTLTLSGASSNTATGEVKVGGGILALAKTGGQLAIGSSAAPLTIVSSGTVRLDASEQIGARPLVVAGGTLDVQTFTEALDGAITLAGGTITGAGAGNVIFGANVTATGASTLASIVNLPASRTFTLPNAADLLTVSGVLQGSNGFAKAGPGEMRLVSANTISGAVAVNGGILRLQDDGSMLNAPIINVGQGGEIVVDNRNVQTPSIINRLKDDAVINLGGGALTVHAPILVSVDAQELIGGINVGNGLSTISINGGDRNPTTNRNKLTATNLTRSGNGMLVMTSTNTADLGKSSSRPQLHFTNILDRDGVTSVATGDVRRFIGGWAIHEEASGLPSFAYHGTGAGSGNDGVKPVEGGTFAAAVSDFETAVPDAGTTHFVRTTGLVGGSLTSDRNYESFSWRSGGTGVASDFTISAGATMTLMSGGLIRSSTSRDASITIHGSGNITAGNTYDANYHLFLHGGSDDNTSTTAGLFINANIVDNIAGPDLLLGTFDDVTNPVTVHVASNLAAVVQLAGNNTYTGGTIVEKGILVVGSDSALGSGGSVTLHGTLRWNADGTLSTHPINIASTSAALDVVDGVVMTAASDITGMGLNKTGAGTLTFTGAAKSYTGPTTVSGGALRISSRAVVPHLIQLEGGVIESSGSQNYTLGTGPGDIGIGAAGGGFSAFGGAHTVDLGGAGASDFVWGSTANFPGNGIPLTFGSTTANNTVALIDNIDLNGAARTIQVNDNPNSSADLAVLSGVISGGVGSELTKTGMGALSIPDASFNYAGPTNVNGGALRVASPASVPHLINLGGGVVETSGTFDRILGTGPTNVNFTAGGGFAAFGGPLTVNLNGGGADNLVWATSNFASGSLLLSSATADNVVTFTDNLNLNGANRSINVADNPASGDDLAIVTGLITDGGSLEFNKSGTGTLVLPDSSIGYASTTVTRLNGGALRISGSDAIPGRIRLSDGVVETSGNFYRPIGTAAGEINWTNNGGFAAFGAPLSVDLNAPGVDTIVWGGTGATAEFLGPARIYVLGSATANDVVTLVDNLDLNGGTRNVQVLDNTFSSTDAAVISGVISGAGASKLNKLGAGTLTLTNANTHAGGTLVSEGKLVAAHAQALAGGALTINSGAVAEIAVGLNVPVPISSLLIHGTGLLDVTDSKVQLNYTGASPFADVRSAIIAGRNGGTWNGTSGITSSLATGATAVGVVDNGANVTFAYTLGADSNLDYAVNFDDLLVLAQFYGTTGTAVWANGDFNYDTNVNFDDLLLLAQLYGDDLIPEMALMQGAGFSPSFAADVQSAFAAVPEPGTLGLLAVGALGLLGRRRRHNRA